jgi:hypothetical protein
MLFEWGNMMGIRERRGKCKRKGTNKNIQEN